MMKNTAKIAQIKAIDDIVREGTQVFSPADAKRVFETCRYERNRDERRGATYIDALARQMISGDWVARQPIDFARLPDGDLILVNGHHRMLAQVAAGTSIEWTVLIHDCETMDDVADLYRRYDTVVRTRTTAQIMASVDAAARFEVSKGLTDGLTRAVVFIDNGMRPPSGIHQRRYTPGEILDLMECWQQEARVYDECVAPADVHLKRKMFTAQVMAIALVTLRVDNARACDFWAGVASDDGLRRGDPRKTLVDYLRSTHGASGSVTSTAVACARAWGAWHQGREITFLRVGNQAVRISGTKLVVKS